MWMGYGVSGFLFTVVLLSSQEQGKFSARFLLENLVHILSDKPCVFKCVRAKAAINIRLFIIGRQGWEQGGWKQRAQDNELRRL